MTKVVINSMPKSGTHLLAKLIRLIGFQDSHVRLMASLVRETERNPITRWKKKNRKVQSGSNEGLPIDLGIPDNWIRKDWLHNLLIQIPEGSYAIAHLPFSPELSDFLSIHDFHIVHMFRDPRDVLISYIHYLKTLKKYPLSKDFIQMDKEQSIDAVLSGLKKGRITFSPLSVQLDRSKGWIDNPNTLAIRFEDLVGPKGYGSADKQKYVISEIFDKLSISVSSDRLDQIAEDVFDPKSRTFRNGKISQWKDWFDTPIMMERIAELDNLVKEYGYI